MGKVVGGGHPCWPRLAGCLRRSVNVRGTPAQCQASSARGRARAIAAAWRSIVKRSSTRSRPAAPIAARSAGRSASSAAAPAHAAGSPGASRQSLDAVLEDLRGAADGGREHRHAERHRLDHRAPEGLLLGGQQQHVERRDQLAYVLRSPEPRDAVGQARARRPARAAPRRRRGCQSASRARRTWPSRSAAGARRRPCARSISSASIAVSWPFHGLSCATTPSSSARSPAAPSPARAASRSIRAGSQRARSSALCTTSTCASGAAALTERAV